jgi:hypothetical protein
MGDIELADFAPATLGPPWFGDDIARMSRPGKAMSEQFVNALCDRIQPNLPKQGSHPKPDAASGIGSRAIAHSN